MKNPKLTIALIWLTCIGLILMVLLGSCSAKYHFTKFLAKGGKIDTTERIIEVKDTIRVNGKDSIITLRMPFNCPSVQIPPTRLETRLEYRLDKRKLKALQSMYEDSINNLNQQLKYAYKTHKTDKKAEHKKHKTDSKPKYSKFELFCFGFFCACVVCLILWILIRKRL